ncbi:hypothetical protein KI387_037269, partial [Taxus chinensis]
VNRPRIERYVGMAGNGKTDKAILPKRSDRASFSGKRGSEWIFSDFPSDIVIEVDGVSFALHKFTGMVIVSFAWYSGYRVGEKHEFGGEIILGLLGEGVCTYVAMRYSV